MTPASAYLDTRVSLFAARLWRDAELDALALAADDALTATLDRRGLPQLRRAQAGHSLEHRIVAQLLEETRVLIRPLAEHARDFLLTWTARFEMSNVKTLLRSKMTGERPAAAAARLVPMGAFGRLDVDALTHAEGIGELLRRLEAGPYAPIVREARHAFEQTHDPFSLDAALDRGYYEALAARAAALDATLGDAFVVLMGRVIDRTNLLWLLRYRFNYGLPPAQVYYLLVASRYGLSAHQLRHLATQQSVDAVLDALPPMWRVKLAGAAGIPEVHARMEHATAEAARRLLRSRAPALARAFAYLILRERDLRAVRGVLRGHELALPPEDIRRALHREGAVA